MALVGVGTAGLKFRRKRPLFGFTCLSKDIQTIYTIGICAFLLNIKYSCSIFGESG